MDIKSLRRAHLEHHIRPYRTAELFLEALNDALQAAGEDPIASGYLSQLRAGPPKGRNIGDVVARKLEIGLGLPPNAFDMKLDSEATDLDREAAAIADKWRRLPPERREAARAALEAFAQDLPKT